MIKKVCPVCGKEFYVAASRKNQICCSKKCSSVRAIKDIKGNRYGKLTVVSYVGRKNGNSMWNCKCDCGNEIIVQYGNLISGASTQCFKCGVIQAHNKTRKHFGKGTRLYRIWKNMRVRCTNPNFKAYKYYGGRGITICNEWNDFITFQKWAMGNGYLDNLTIDRINGNGNYEPNNCRWVDMRTQANNTRRNHYITINNQKHTIAEWARIYNIKREIIKDRIASGWDEVKAVTTPKKENK